MSETQFTIKRSFWDSKPRNLTLAKDYLEYEDKVVGDDKPTRLAKDQIREFRYGIVWLRGLYFYVGRQYVISIRTREGQELKIDFVTYYGINKKQLNKTLADITNAVFELYFKDQFMELLEKFIRDEPIEVCGVKIHKAGVTLESKGLLKTKVYDIPWDQLKTKRYQTYYAVYSSENAADINKSYKYLEDYNTYLLSCVLETILDNKREAAEHSSESSFANAR